MLALDLLLVSTTAFSLGNNGVPPFFGAPIVDGFNPLDKSAIISLPDNLTYATNGSAGTQAGVRSIIGKNSGKLYFGYTATSTALRNGTGIGIATAAFTLANVPTTSAATFWSLQLANGNVWFNGTDQSKNLGVLTATHVKCVAVDFTNSRAWMRIDAGNWLADASANPATNTNGVDISALFPTNLAYILGTSNDNATHTLGSINITASACGANAPTSGFSAWNFLLQRDLNPSANHNRPMFTEAVA